jgi:hydrogenase maturation factor HypE
MPVIVTKLATLLMAALGFITITTTSIIIYTEEGDKVEINYESLIEQVKEEIRDRIEEDPNEYINPHGEFIGQESVEDAAINAVIERSISDEVELSDKQREAIYDKLRSKLGDASEEIVSEVKEQIEEAEILRRNPLNYHGLKESDFYE